MKLNVFVNDMMAVIRERHSDGCHDYRSIVDLGDSFGKVVIDEMIIIRSSLKT